jgi:uncharacterized membrane-anchored protein YjiN (DUF445 family)
MSITMESPADLVRAAALRRMKIVATGLLGVMAVIFVIAWILQDRHPWLGYVRAMAEAGMVGALADWFAVTALFRRPLGLPIPHTAIIPERKDAIGESLTSFVADNFLNEAVVRDKLARFSVAERAGRWLAKPESATRVSAELGAALNGIGNVLNDDDVSDVMASIIQRRATEFEVGPPLGKILGDVVSRGDHHDVVDVIVERAHEWVLRNEHMISGLVANRAPAWTPRFLDMIVTDKLYTEVERFVRGVRDDKNHQLRRAVDNFLTEFADDLQHDDITRARVESIKTRIIENPEVQKLVRSAWGSLKVTLLDAANDPTSTLRVRVAGTVADFGQKLLDDPELAGKIDRWIADAAGYGARHYAHQIAAIINETVANWDGEATSRKLELLVGRDLQFIRINGTVVGSLAGLVIYTVAHNFLG